MNKTALKNFATWSRRKLIEQVRTKAFLYGIDEKNGLHMEEQFGQLVINGHSYPLSMRTAFTALQKQLEQKGYEQLVEEIAYTWFNRIIAIRYMEVHEFLPEKVNVLSSAVGRVDPDILFEYDMMDLAIDEAKVRELINTGDTEAAFRLLFVAQCNALNAILPFMFEKIQDYTELLLPDFLLDAESVIKTLVQKDELTESFAEIEVIGWLYQYYIAEEKDRVFAQKSKYKKEEIPFATQLFTPKWIVQYMVQNSLGRYWTEAHREDEDLIDNWEYFIKHEEEDFHEKIAPYVNKELKVEDIKLLDPAMGSGHILVYAFEVFHEIYAKCGYPERDIPRLILENNLYGLDIDDRAYQLASFAVVMKAASYSKRFLRSVEREGITLNLASIQETNHISDEVIAYIAQEDVGERYNQVKAFFEQYYNAKTYGSLINITEREITFIEERFEQIANNPVHDLFYGEQHEIAKQVLPALIHQTKIMRNEYDNIITNPPYMGSGKMSSILKDFVLKNYEDAKEDIYMSFFKMKFYLKKDIGLIAMINQQSWMFLTRAENLRKFILNNYTIDSMIHLGTRTFEELSGEVVQSTAFVLRNKKENLNSIFLNVTDLNTKEKLYAVKNSIKYKDDRFTLRNQRVFNSIPGFNISYWISKQALIVLQNSLFISDYGETRKGMVTSDNPRFIRNWYEVNPESIGFGCKDRLQALESNKKWFPYQKGGSSIKWYGNNLDVVDWEFDGKALLNMKSEGYKVGSTNHNLEFIFKPAIVWNKISTNNFTPRIVESGFLYDDASPFLSISDEKYKYYLLALLSSDVARYYLNIINPTLNFQPGNIANIPVVIDEKKFNVINELSKENINLSKELYDIQELSWEYKAPVFLNDNKGSSLEDMIKISVNRVEEIVNKIQENEKKINIIFNGIYHFSNETESFNKSNEENKYTEEYFVKQFISYFIGVQFGRYKLPEIYSQVEIIMDVISLTEKHYLKTDIYLIFNDFLKLVSDEKLLESNLNYIAGTLSKTNGNDNEKVIRDYLVNDFVIDHNNIYKNTAKQKLPIYWLVESGKHKGLRTLIYMHRYTPDTMATIRFKHLQEMQAKYQQEIADLDNRLVNPNLSPSDKKKLNAEKVSFEKKIDELREFDKRLAEIAAEEIEIDLDDGVKVNYEKFYRGGKGVLAKIK